MKSLILFFTLLCNSFAHAQTKLELYDIAGMQLRLMERSAALDSVSRSRLFIDSVYKPYHEFWEGYIGAAADLATWMEEAMPRLKSWQEKNKLIQRAALLKDLNTVAKKLKKMSGYAPVGKWYIVYGPAWTDLGGLSDFAMLIDLAHASNSSNERILNILPHELTHQIMTSVKKDKDSTAIESIINEGFAVWMNQRYWGKKLSLAQNLGYTEEELQLCDKNIEALKKFLAANKFSANKDIINVFRNRTEKINQKLPGAIGYYLGYRIVEAYVKKRGKHSWKDIFTMSSREVYRLSGFAS